MTLKLVDYEEPMERDVSQRLNTNTKNGEINVIF